MNKATLYKALKTACFLVGFPLMIIVMIITMAPMFDPEVTGNYAQNWIIIFVAIWFCLLIIHFLLEKFVGAKSLNHHKLVLVVMSGLSILCVLLPSAFYDAAMRSKYETAQNKLVGEVNVKDYDALMGWHRDFTERYKSETYVLINEHYDFLKLYGLASTESSWYDNADKENNLGYKYGSFEKAKKLVADKLDALEKLESSKAELAAIEAEIDAKKTAYDDALKAAEADPSNAQLQTAAQTALDEYNAILDEKDEDLVRLKGQRVNIADYKEELITIVVDVIKNNKEVLPDGLNIDLLGINLPIHEILNYSLIKSIIDGVLTPDMLMGIVPDVIYTGIGPQTVSTYQKAVDGSDSDVSLAEAQKLDFKFSFYPSVLAAGAMRYVCYIFVGIVVFSIFATDFFARKQKEEEEKNV